MVWYLIGVDLLPYMNYNGMCRCEGKGFLVVIVWRRVWKRRKFGLECHSWELDHWYDELEFLV